MSQFDHPNCMHPQPHCPFCDCDDCFHIAQQQVRRQGANSASTDATASAAPVAPASAALAPATVQYAPQASSWWSSPSSRYVLWAGVGALTLGLWITAHTRRHRHFVLHHRLAAAMSTVPPTAQSTASSGTSAYEAGFLKGSEMTAAMYRASQASAFDAVRSQWSRELGRGWCRHRGW